MKEGRGAPPATEGMEGGAPPGAAEGGPAAAAGGCVSPAMGVPGVAASLFSLVLLVIDIDRTGLVVLRPASGPAPPAFLALGGAGVEGAVWKCVVD